MKQKIEIEIEIPDGHKVKKSTPSGSSPTFITVCGEVAQINQEIVIQLEKEEPEHPQFKSFIIAWDINSDRAPLILDDDGETFGARAIVGSAVFPYEDTTKYRIFRFGDEPEYNHFFSYPQPSDEIGNCKYAYGRLEA